MANTPSKKQDEKRPDIAPVEEMTREETAVVKDAKNRLYTLHQRRETAVNSLGQAVQNAKNSEQNAFVLRGRISVFDEEIAEIKQKYHLEDPVQ